MATERNENEASHDVSAHENSEEVLHTETHTEPESSLEAAVGQFGLSAQKFSAQTVNFLIVLIILTIFVYKPVVKLLDERKEKIEKGLKRAKEIEKRLTAIEDEREKIILEAKTEAKKIAEKAKEDGEARSAELVNSAKREVERVIAKGKQQLQQEKSQMMRGMKKEIADIALKATARILQDQVDERKSQSLAEEVVRKMT